MSRVLVHLPRVLQTSWAAPILRCYDEAGRLLRQQPTPPLGRRNQRTSHKTRGPGLLLLPPSSSGAGVCNFTLQRQTAGQEENVWPTLAFVLISLSNVQTLLPLGYLKWCVVEIRSLSSSFSSPDTPSQLDKWRRRSGLQDTTRQREEGGAAEMEQMFVWLLICGLIRARRRQLELMAC